MRIFSILALATTSFVAAQELSIQKSNNQVELSWLRELPPTSGVSSSLEDRLFFSPDLKSWTLRQSEILQNPAEAGPMTLSFPLEANQGFFQLQRHLQYAHPTSPSSPPPAYQQQFQNAIAGFRTIQIPDKSDCLNGISWDPTTSCYWTEFNTTPEEHNAALPADHPDRRLTDFSLNEAEIAKFKENGFVVAPRIDLFEPEPFAPYPRGGAATPVDYYYQLWADDLPVFITSDSVLEAWHVTFLGMLEELEEIHLYPFLRTLIGDLQDLSNLNTEWENRDLPGADQVRQALADLNVYLGTAHLLLQGNDNQPMSEDASDPAHWFHAAIVHQDIAKNGLYGDVSRLEDMTLFQPRGHYSNSEALSVYFQGFLWLSRAQFQLGHATPTPQSDRELRAAALLALHLRDGGFTDRWSHLEGFLKSLSGQSDAMTVVEMAALLESLSLDTPEDLASDANLATIRSALMATTYGVQEIDGGTSNVECNPTDYVLPRALSLFGQRWTPDAWTFQNVVFPKITKGDEAIARRIPSGLDVTFATLGNNAAMPLLEQRMNEPNGVPFRDGYDYRENLASLRSVFDSQEEGFWTDHTYVSWLHSLRGLSQALPSQMPDTFRTRAWKHRILNTQLASWTHLRHDTLLYAEQSFTPPLICEFPTGYVDPYPDLWRRLSAMALQFREILRPIELSGGFQVTRRSGSVSRPFQLLQNWTVEEGYFFDWQDPAFSNLPAPDLIQIDRGSRIELMMTHLDHFSERCLTLAEIADRELEGSPHTPEALEFIKDTVETFNADSCIGIRQYTGWFPHLYFQPCFSLGQEHPAAQFNPVVVDVHTDSENICYGNPGAILHEGVGRAQLMIMAIKHPDGTSCVYGGPVMSHYEFLESRDTRRNNDQWIEMLGQNTEPPFEDWQLEFLVPVAE